MPAPHRPTCLAVAGFVALAVAFAPLPCAAGSWTATVHDGAFVFHADFPLDTLKPLLDDMIGLENDLTAALALPRVDDQPPIDVYLLHDQPTYAAYLALNVPAAPYRRALFAETGRTRMVFAYRSPALEVDLRHECTHALLHRAVGNLPLWLDEGLAQYFEIPESQRATGGFHAAAVRRRAIAGKVQPLSKLEAMTALDEMDLDAYHDAWAWTYLFLHESAASRNDLVVFLAELHGQSPAEPLSLRAARRWPSPAGRLAEHFRQRPPALAGTVGEESFAPDDPADELPADQGVAAAARRSFFSHRD